MHNDVKQIGMNLFIKQVDKLRIKTATKLRTYMLWNNTDSGRDKNDCYERIEENGFVEYVNTNNVDMRVVRGDDFFNTLEELYNCATTTD